MGAVAFKDLITFTRASGGGRFNASGQYEWLPANTPRIDYDPVTGEAKGLLIEEQRTNLLLQSSSFQSASWIKASGVALATDTLLAPDGSVAQRVDLVGTGHNIQQGVSPLSVGAAYTFSVWVRPKTTPFPFQLAYYDSSTQLNGTQITPEAGKWTRLSFTFTPNTLASSPLIRLIGFGNGNVGDSLYIWGAQLEAGSSPSSYIPTTTAQVTRAADVPSVNVLSPWYNPEQGTWLVEFEPAAGVSFPRLISYSDIARSFLELGSSGRLGTWSGVGLTTTNPATYGAANKGAITYSSLGRSLSLNGGAVASDANLIDPAVKGIRLGANHGGAQYLNGHIRSIRYYPKRLSDSELQELTK